MRSTKLPPFCFFFLKRKDGNFIVFNSSFIVNNKTYSFEFIDFENVRFSPGFNPYGTNPDNITRVEYYIHKSGNLSIIIIEKEVLGDIIFYENEFRQEGYYQFIWDGHFNEKKLANGIYQITFLINNEEYVHEVEIYY